MPSALPPGSLASGVGPHAFPTVLQRGPLLGLLPGNSAQSPDPVGLDTWAQVDVGGGGPPMAQQAPLSLRDKAAAPCSPPWGRSLWFW